MMSGVGEWSALYDKFDDSPAFCRLLRYGEQRYWFLTSLESSGGTGTVEGVGLTPEGWEYFCQQWRIQLETQARLRDATEVVAAGHEFFRATLVAAFATAFRRLTRPGLKYVELWCTGEVRRIKLLEANENHGTHCACQIFNDTLFELEEVAQGLDPWIKWAVPGEPKVWALLHGMCGPHVVRLVHGAPSSLEDATGFGHTPESPFAWGMPNGATYLLAAALIEDATGERQDPEVWERFGNTILCAFEPGQQFVVTFSDVADWLSTPTERRGWPALWSRARTKGG